MHLVLALGGRHRHRCLSQHVVHFRQLKGEPLVEHVRNGLEESGLFPIPLQLRSARLERPPDVRQQHQELLNDSVLHKLRLYRCDVAARREGLVDC